MDRPENCFQTLLEEFTNYSPCVHTLKDVYKYGEKKAGVETGQNIRRLMFNSTGLEMSVKTILGRKGNG
jgi:hypothetical protein